MEFSTKAAVFIVSTVRISLWLNILVSFVDQVKQLLALNYGRFEAIRHKIRSRSFQETFSEGRMAIVL